MREIRFRAWDVKYKEMLQVFRTDSHPDLIAPHSVIAGTAGGGHIVSRPLLNLQGQEPEFILMQFTGLHDKHGKEIFESDRIRWDGGEYVVVWSGWDGWMLKDDRDDCDCPNLYAVSSPAQSRIEIIGHIYET